MTPPRSPGPEALYDKPGSINLAQAMMWIQFSILFFGGAGSAMLAWYGLGFAQLQQWLADYEAEGFRDFLYYVGGIALALVLVGLVYGMLTWGLGAGRRWAQAGTFLLLLVVIVASVAAVASVSISPESVVVLCVWLLLPGTTVACLASSSANQWFRQRGWEPWYERYYSRGRPSRRPR